MGQGSIFRVVARFFAGGRTVRDLAEVLGATPGTLAAVEVKYTRFYIRKRCGGFREIHAPDDALKRLQRRILRRVLRGLPAHPAATAFERGRSIVDNAGPHARRAVVVNLDLVDFFPSIEARRVHGLFRRCRWGRGARRLLTGFCTHEGCLPQGAPTSPRLSNLVSGYLDIRLEHLASSFEARYTRYADDITFSFQEDRRPDIHRVLGLARKIIRSEGHAVHRRKKLSIRRAHQRQEVTGLVVNDGPRLPRETRRWLRAVQHRFRKHGRATLTRDQLQGWLSYAAMIRRAQ